MVVVYHWCFKQWTDQLNKFIFKRLVLDCNLHPLLLLLLNPSQYVIQFFFKLYLNDIPVQVSPLRVFQATTLSVHELSNCVRWYINLTQLTRKENKNK